MGTFCVFVLCSLRNLCRFHFHQVFISCPMIFIFFSLSIKKSTFKKPTSALYSPKATWEKPEEKNSSPIPKKTKATPYLQLVKRPGTGRWLWPVEIPNIQLCPSLWVLHHPDPLHGAEHLSCSTKICHSSHEQQSSPRHYLG